MARLLCTLIFWVLMTADILASAVVVLLLYLPFVALKAIWLKLTGRIAKVTAESAAETEKPMLGHPGL